MWRNIGMSQDRFEYEVMQELWWLEQDQDAEWVKAQEALAKEREIKRNQEERKDGTYGN